jgi:hypothetical protein
VSPALFSRVSFPLQGPEVPAPFLRGERAGASSSAEAQGVCRRAIHRGPGSVPLPALRHGLRASSQPAVTSAHRA